MNSRARFWQTSMTVINTQKCLYIICFSDKRQGKDIILNYYINPFISFFFLQKLCTKYFYWTVNIKNNKVPFHSNKVQAFSKCNLHMNFDWLAVDNIYTVTTLVSMKDTSLIYSFHHCVTFE